MGESLDILDSCSHFTEISVYMSPARSHSAGVASLKAVSVNEGAHRITWPLAYTLKINRLKNYSYHGYSKGPVVANCYLFFGGDGAA